MQSYPYTCVDSEKVQVNGGKVDVVIKTLEREFAEAFYRAATLGVAQCFFLIDALSSRLIVGSHWSAATKQGRSMVAELKHLVAN